MIHRASGLGGCLKGQCAAALGMKAIEPDDKSLTRMGEGELHEMDVISRLTMDGYTVTRQQEEVHIVCAPEGVAHPVHAAVSKPGYMNSGIVQGHLDGVVSGDPFTPSGPKVLEVKSMSDSMFRDFHSKGWHGDWPAGSLVDKYRWQLSVYMLATGLEGLLVTKNRNSGETVKVGVEIPFYSLDQITARVAYIEDHVARGQLPDECPHDWFCNFKYLCQAAPKPDSDTEDTVPEPVIEYWDVGQRIAVLEAQRKLLRPVVEEFLGNRPSVISGGYKIQTITQQIKERIVPASTRTMLRVTKLEDSDED